MKYKKYIPFILIIICIIFLVIAENYFQARQDLLVLESNNLFSSHHMLSKSFINTTWKKQYSSADEFMIFGILQNSEEVVMGFYTTDYSDVRIPLRNGNFFAEPDSRESIVGEDVETFVKKGIEYIQYDRNDYKVIGKLGVSNDSPLKKHILINDSSLLENENTPLIFDGDKIKNIEWLVGDFRENKGVERWFNINFISNLIGFSTLIIIVLSSVLAVYFYFIGTRNERLIKFIIGVNSKKIIKNDLLIIFTTSIVISTIFSFFVILDVSRYFLERMAIYYIVFLLIILITYIIFINKVLSRS